MSKKQNQTTTTKQQLSGIVRNNVALYSIGGILKRLFLIVGTFHLQVASLEREGKKFIKIAFLLGE